MSSKYRYLGQTLILFIAIAFCSGLGEFSFANTLKEPFGLVTQSIMKDDSMPVGRRLVQGQTLVLKLGERVEVTDTVRHRYHFAGPSEVILHAPGTIILHDGSVFVRSSRGHKAKVETVRISGEVEGIAVVWNGSDTTQWSCLEGNSTVWHPELSQARTNVQAGYFTDMTANEGYLQPHSAMPVDRAALKAFLSRFREQVPTRMPASESVNPRKVEAIRKHESVVEEPRDPELMARLKARIEGRDYEEVLAEKQLVQSETSKKKRASMQKHLNRVVAREKAFQDMVRTKPQRAIASEIKPLPQGQTQEKPADPDEGPRPTIIQRLIKQGQSREEH